MGEAERAEEHELAVADQAEEQPVGRGSADTAIADQRDGVLDLTETGKPARRFYANLADL